MRTRPHHIPARWLPMLLVCVATLLLAWPASAGRCSSRSGLSVSVGFSTGHGSFRFGHGYHGRSYFSYRYPGYYYGYHRPYYHRPYYRSSYYRPYCEPAYYPPAVSTVVVRPYDRHRDYTQGVGLRDAAPTVAARPRDGIAFEERVVVDETGLRGDAEMEARRRADRFDAGFVSRAVPVSTELPAATERPAAVSATEAWGMLGEKRYRDAQLAFARQMSATPRDPSPKVGFGLASALLGETARAERAFDHAALLDAHIWDRLGARPASRDAAIELLADRGYAPSDATRARLDRLSLAAEPTDYEMPAWEDERSASRGR